jgi:hypothetical protein
VLTSFDQNNLSRAWLSATDFRKKISIYSGLSGKKLDELNRRWAAKYGAAFKKDWNIRKLVETLVVPEDRKEEIFKLRVFVREWMYRQIREMTLFVYLSMKKRKDFGNAGEERLKMSYCRNILDIPANCYLNFMDIISLDAIIAGADSRNGNRTGDEYLMMVKNVSLELFGEMIPLSALDSIEQFLETDRFSYYSAHPMGLKIMFGKVTSEEFCGKKVYRFRQEYIRSPQYFLSNVAFVSETAITIRNEACSVVFFNKWECYFDEPKRKKIVHPTDAITDGLKDRSLHLYGIHDKRNFLDFGQQIMLEDAIECIKVHEIGHNIASLGMDPIHRISINCFCGDDTNAIYSLREMLADWAPKLPDGRLGSFEYFIQVARNKGRKIAESMIYVYLSDNFFISKEEPDFCGLMTNVLVGIVLGYIQDDRSIDFILMSNEKRMIYDKAQELLKIAINRLMNNIFLSKYQIRPFTVNYQQLDDEIFAIYRKGKAETYSREDMKKDWTYWENLVYLVRYFSPKGGSKRHTAILAEEAIGLESFVLNLAARGKPQRYNNSLREFIYRRFQEIGLTKKLVQNPIFRH